MNRPRLIKRRTVTTEELFDDGPCPVRNIDATSTEDVDTSAEPTSATRTDSHDKPTMKGAETAGIDDMDLEGDED